MWESSRKIFQEKWTQLNENNENRAQMLFIFFITRKVMFLQGKRVGTGALKIAMISRLMKARKKQKP
jgi:hypothetical protein